jgi:hypothetical protein
MLARTSTEVAQAISETASSAIIHFRPRFPADGIMRRVAGLSALVALGHGELRKLAGGRTLAARTLPRSATPAGEIC